MLGLVVVNSLNDIVQSFGNKQFYDHIESLNNENSSKTVLNRFSSSSSGISSLPSTFAQNNLPLNHKIDDNKLLEFILPLLVIYQKNKASENDLNFLSSDCANFYFLTYDPSHIIIGISDEKYSQIEIEQLCHNIFHLLNFHYGPFIQFIKADLSSIKRKKHKVQRRVNDLIYQAENGNLKFPLLNVNGLIVNPDPYLSFMPQFRKIVAVLSESIGNCRCIFISRGQIIGSVSTKQKQHIPLFELIDPNDINNLIQMSKLFDQSVLNLEDNESMTRKKLQHHIEQVWVHFRNDAGVLSPKNRRQFVNALFFSFTGEIDLICLNAIEQSVPIHTLSDLLDLLEDIESVQDKMALVTVIEEKLRKLTTCIGNFKAKCLVKDFKCVFLENPSRTTMLIKNLWSRLSEELLRSLSSNEDKKQRSYSSLWSATSKLSPLYKWGSALSLISSTTSFQSLTSSKTTYSASSGLLSIQTVAMIKHFQRQLRLILNEFCMYSGMLSKSEKYKLAENALRKTMDKTSNFTFNSLVSQSIDVSRFLTPAKLGYDMLGYVFYRTDVPINIHSYKEVHAKIFLQVQSQSSDSEITILRLEGGQMFIQIARLSSDVSPGLDLPVSCGAVFPDVINTRLAIRQTIDLALLLFRRSGKVLSMFE
uniref:Uncharacterized protein n=1 Tax=Panagrolaimus sp. JU765 TaxID=591449 RepID=A0AC34RIJ3_9BILA